MQMWRPFEFAQEPVQERVMESSSRPMSPIISRRVEREDSEEIIEARLSALYSVFFMAILFFYSTFLFCFCRKIITCLCQSKAHVAFFVFFF